MNFILTQSLYRLLPVILIVYVFWSGQADATTDTNLIVTATGEYSQHQLSADGRYLLYTERHNSRDTLWSITTDGKQAPVKLTPDFAEKTNNISSFVISPDGDTVAYKVAITKPFTLGDATYMAGQSEHLYTARMDGSRPPVLHAEDDFHDSKIRIDPSSSHATEKIHAPFEFEYLFSDDSQYLLYVHASDFSAERSTKRVYRSQVDDPSQTVEISKILKYRVSSDFINQYGFVPQSHDVYLSYSEELHPQYGRHQRQLFVIHIDSKSAPSLTFSATHFHQHFLDDGKRLLLVSPDELGVKQFFVYDLATGNRMLLSTAKTHQEIDLIYRSSYFGQIALEVYGDWVLYFPRAPVAPFYTRPVKAACYITHLNHPEYDRRISDSCPSARVLLAEKSIYYDTFETNPVEAGSTVTGPYYLMSQALDGSQPAIRLTEGHWNAGFESPNIFTYRATPDGQWAHFEDGPRVPNEDTRQVQWIKLNDNPETLTWDSFRYPYQYASRSQAPLFTGDGTRILAFKSTPVPVALQRSYDPLLRPQVENPEKNRLKHIPMADNCRIFSHLERANSNQYYMSDCDRPWTELWWDPEFSGQGLRVQQVGDRVFLAWFTYDDNHEAAWVTLSGQLKNNQLQGELIHHTGPTLGASWDSDQVQGTPVGHATMSLNQDQTTAGFDYQIGNVQGHLNLRPFYSGPANQYDGFWWNSDTSGQGLQIYHKGNYLFGCIYLYNESGKNFWVTFQGTLVGKEFKGQLKQFTGPRLGEVWDAQQVLAKNVGNITLKLIGADRTLQSTNGSALLAASKPSFIAMDYTINGKKMHLDLERFRF